MTRKQEEDEAEKVYNAIRQQAWKAYRETCDEISRRYNEVKIIDGKRYRLSCLSVSAE